MPVNASALGSGVTAVVENEISSISQLFRPPAISAENVRDSVCPAHAETLAPYSVKLGLNCHGNE